MKAKSWMTIAIVVSMLIITGCQTTLKSNQNMSKDIDRTVLRDVPPILIERITINLDSDGDGITDDIDMCPGTPMNMTVDERGCPFQGIGIGFKMEYRAFFAKGSSELSKEYQLELDKIAQKLQEFYTATMRIEGHASTDEISATDTVLQLDSLSRYRALIVKNYLVQKHQIDPERLSTSSYGAERPITSSDTEEGKSMNRRVYGVATEPKD